MGVFYAAAAAAVSTGAPISGNILVLHGWLGLQGWQWIFLIEAAPAVLIASVAPFVLRDRPADANWLKPVEREWLQTTLAAEQASSGGQQLSQWAALRSMPIVLMTTAYLLIGFGVYANVFFLPLMIKDLGFSNLVTSYLSAMPAALGVLGMILVSRSSDRTGERVWHVTLCTLAAGIGLVLAGVFTGDRIAEFGSLCVVGFAISAALPTFWNLPTAYFGPAAAAAGIAAINSIGNIAGYAAPQLVGILRDRTGTYSIALVVVGVMSLVAAGLLPFAGAPARAAQLRRAAV
jgi:MFS transporter, ACS family, tartrate transporter